MYPELSALEGSRALQEIQVKEESSVRLATSEFRATLVLLESEECLDQKEDLVLLVQMVVREFLDCLDPRVFQGKVELQVTLGFKDYLVYQELMGQKDIKG